MDLIYSQDFYLLNQKISERLKEISAEEDETYTFSFIEDSLPEIINSIITPPMFASQKVIVLKDSWFLTAKKISLHQTFDLDKFLMILEKKIPTSLHLILTVNNDNLTKTKKIENFVKKTSMLKVEKPNLFTCQNYVYSWLEKDGIKFEKNAWNLFWDIMPLELTYLQFEVQKLTNLNISEITSKMVLDNCVPFLESDIFKLSEAFLKNDYQDFLNRYQIYCQQNNELIPFLILLANGLTILRNYLVLNQQGIKHQEIINYLGVNPYYLNNLLKTNRNTISQLNGKIVLIYGLNKALICGTIDKYTIPEYRFIKLFHHSKKGQ